MKILSVEAGSTILRGGSSFEQHNVLEFTVPAANEAKVKSLIEVVDKNHKDADYFAARFGRLPVSFIKVKHLRANGTTGIPEEYDDDLEILV